jgi:hypothetical protein
LGIGVVSVALQDADTAGAFHDIEVGALVFEALERNAKSVIAAVDGTHSQPCIGTKSASAGEKAAKAGTNV